MKLRRRYEVMRRYRLSRYVSGRHREEAEMYLYPDSTPALEGIRWQAAHPDRLTHG